MFRFILLVHRKFDLVVKLIGGHKCMPNLKVSEGDCLQVDVCGAYQKQEVWKQALILVWCSAVIKPQSDMFHISLMGKESPKTADNIIFITALYMPYICQCVLWAATVLSPPIGTNLLKTISYRQKITILWDNVVCVKGHLKVFILIILCSCQSVTPVVIFVIQALLAGMMSFFRVRIVKLKYKRNKN